MTSVPSAIYGRKQTMSNGVQTAVSSANTIAPKYKGTTKLLDRKHLDGRTRGCKKFKQIVANLIDEVFGGNVPQTSMPLIEALAGWSVSLDDLNASALRGEDVNIQRQQVSLNLLRLAAKMKINVHSNKRRDPGVKSSSSLFTTLQRADLLMQPQDEPTHTKSNYIAEKDRPVEGVIISDEDDSS
jgi:hypothetical protein